MPNYRAVANGNWSALATWQDDGSGSYVASTVLPGAADTVRTNNFIVTVDVNATVLNVGNNSATGVTQGGAFLINNNRTLTATSTAIFPVANWFRLNLGETGTFACPSITITQTNEIFSGRVYNVIGNIINIGGSVSDSIYQMRGGTINHTGNMSAFFSYWIDFVSGGIINITGNLTNGGLGFWVRGVVTLNLVGSLTSANSIAYDNYHQPMTFTHIGPVIAGGNACAISDMAGIYAGTGPFVNNGDFAAVAARRFRLINTSPTSMRLTTAVAGVNRFLYTEDNVGGVPATTNVRSGTVYGIGGGLTGTLVVPSANAVTAGVTYDNGTVGTAQNTAASFLTALAASTDPLAVRLQNVATVQTTGDQIAAAL